MKSLCFLLTVMSLSQATWALETLSDSTPTTTVQSVPTENVGTPRIQSLDSGSARSTMQAPATREPAERLGTSYFQRPHEGRASGRVMPVINSTMANASSGENGESRSVDLNSDALETRLAFGLTKDMFVETHFSYGSDKAKVGGQTFKRSGMSDLFVKATQVDEMNEYDLFYGAELGISPSRAAVAGVSSGENRFSGGTQLTPFVGMQAESIYDFHFGVQGSFTFRTTRFFDDGTDKSGGHYLTAEGFMEKEYAPGTLGLMASLFQKTDDNRDQAGVLMPQTALGLGGYADFEINPQFFIPVQLSYTMGLSNTAGGVSYSKIDRVSIAAGASYYF